MNSKFFLLSLLTIGQFIVAQQDVKFKDNYFHAKYVLKSASKDTIVARIRNIGVWSNKVYSPHTWINRMVFVDDKGGKITRKENELNYLQIIDSEGVKREFHTSYKFAYMDLGLVSVLYDGTKIKFLRDFYFTNLYQTTIGRKDYVIEKGIDTIEMDIFPKGRKKKMIKKFQAYPDLVADLEKVTTDEDLIEVFKKYEAK